MSKPSEKPRVIAVLNQKGGTGKTTITTNLAHAFALDDCRVMVVDADPQGSARDWREANPDGPIPVVGLDRETLPKDLPAIAQGYDWVLIDGAPQVARLTAAAVKAADLVLIPVQPSPYDVWACGELVDVIQARQEVTDGKPKAAFVISRAIKNTKLSREVMQALGDYGFPVLSAKTTQRVAYPTTAAEGLTVFQDTSSSGAAQEIELIKKDVMRLLEHDT